MTLTFKGKKLMFTGEHKIHNLISKTSRLISRNQKSPKFRVGLKNQF